MDILLLVLGIISMLAGIVGSFLPVLPGPPLCYMGLILLHFSKFASFSPSFFIIYGLITLLIFIADFFMPAGVAKVYGASKYGTWGTSIGIVAGIFFLPPFGLIIFPFLGALIGELIQKKPTNLALKAAWGSFLGFLFGIFLKISLCLVMTFHFIKAVIAYY